VLDDLLVTKFIKGNDFHDDQVERCNSQFSLYFDITVKICCIVQCFLTLQLRLGTRKGERQPICKSLLQLTKNILFWMTQYKWDTLQQHSWSNNNSLATARMSDYSVDGSSKFSKSNTRPSSFPWVDLTNIQYKVGVLHQPWISHPKKPIQSIEKYSHNTPMT